MYSVEGICIAGSMSGTQFNKQGEKEHTDIANAENGNSCLPKRSFHVSVFLQSIETSLCDGIPVELCKISESFSA